MSGTLLVTGATGSVGSNAVALALAAGRTVRAPVPQQADAAVLAEMGAEPVVGDVSDRGSVRDAVAGVTAAIHYAALIGSAHRVESIDPTPTFDATATNAELVRSMTPLADGLAQTAAWMRDIGRL